jgi:toxin secretion/phage lysis holin
MKILYQGGSTAFGAVVGYLYGGWSTLMGVLLAMVVIDYVTGMMAAFVEGKLKSEVGFKRIPKKIMIFVLVAVAHLVDSAAGTNDIFRDATIFFYLANELLSVIENAGRIGLPIPEQLKQAVEVLKNKGDVKK